MSRPVSRAVFFGLGRSGRTDHDARDARVDGSDLSWKRFRALMAVAAAGVAGGSRRSSYSRSALTLASWVTTAVFAVCASQVALNAQRAVPGIDGPIPQEPNSVPATPFRIIPADVRTMADIVAEQRALDAIEVAPREPQTRPKFETGRRGLPQNPASPDVSSWPPSAGDALASVPRMLTPGITIEGPTLTDTNSFPPDTMGDVGPTQYFIALNGAMRVYNKATGTLEPGLSFDPNTFFSTTVRNASRTTDPRIRYDRLSGRWFVVYITVAIPNRVVLAVSNSSTITLSTSWTFFSIANTVTNASGQPCLADYETLGIDNSALYMGVSQFCGTTVANASFFNTSGFVGNKAGLLAGSGTVTIFSPLLSGGSGPTSPQGADNADPSSTTGYFVGTDAYRFGQLSIIRIANPGGTPSATKVDLTVPTTSYPLNPPHLGGTKTLDGLDDRLMNAVVRNGRLYSAHAIGVNAAGTTGSATRNGVRWYELDSIATTPTVRQSGTIFDPTASSPLYFWLPSINVNSVGDAVVGYSASSTAAFAGAAASHRRATDLLGTMQASTTLVSGSASYNPPGDTQYSSYYRWGDYSMVSVDPSDDITFWTAQMYGRSTNIYGTRVLRLTVSGVSGCAVITIPQTTLPNMAVGVGYGLTITASGGTAPYSFSVTAGALPAGMTLTSAGVLAGTPTTAGTFTFTIRATDASGCFAELSYTTLIPSAPGCAVIAIAQRALPNMAVGVGYGLTITASGGAAPYRFSLTVGALPPGMTLTAAGVLAGTPTTGGTYTFTIRATDASGCFAELSYTMFLAQPPILRPPGPPLSFSASPVGFSAYLGWLPPATGGAPASYTIEAGSVTGAADFATLSTTGVTYAASTVGNGTYYLRVRAVNAAGTSAPSNEAILVIGNGCFGAPAAPASLRASVFFGVVTLQWDAASDNPTTYLIEAGSTPGAKNLVNGDLESAETSLVSSNVARGTYYVRMRGKNACGTGPASNEIVVNVP